MTDTATLLTLHSRVELALTLASGPFDRRELVHQAIDEVLASSISPADILAALCACGRGGMHEPRVHEWADA